jgi:hypothetical protein
MPETRAQARTRFKKIEGWMKEHTPNTARQVTGMELREWRRLVLDNQMPLVDEWIKLIEIEKITIHASQLVIESMKDTGAVSQEHLNFLLDTTLMLIEQIQRAGEYVGAIAR